MQILPITKDNLTKILNFISQENKGYLKKYYL